MGTLKRYVYCARVISHVTSRVTSCVTVYARRACRIRFARAGLFAVALFGARIMAVMVAVAGIIGAVGTIGTIGTASAASAAAAVFAAPGEKSNDKPKDRANSGPNSGPGEKPGEKGAKNEGSAKSGKNANQALVLQIGHQLGQSTGIRTRFVQTQTLTAMKAPLTSTGTLLFVRDQGAIWQITSPYPATYVMTNAGVMRIGPDGRRIDGKNARGIAEVSRLMRAMLDGDLSALYSQFDVQAEGAPARWRVRLVPSQPQIAQVITQLQMEGGRTLRTLRIAFRSGDSMRFDFSDTVAVARPTASETALFNAAH